MWLQKPTDELGKAYVSFMRVSLDQLRQRVVDEIYVLTIFEVKTAAAASGNRARSIHCPWVAMTEGGVAGQYGGWCSEERMANTVAFESFEPFCCLNAVEATPPVFPAPDDIYSWNSQHAQSWRESGM